MEKIALFLVVLISSSVFANAPSFEIDVKAKVIRVIDGDTFKAFPVGTVRLADINAPELNEAGGVEAKQALHELVFEKTVYLDVDDVYITDRYDRIVAVAYVRINSTHLLNVNKWLVENNYVRIVDFENEFDPKSWQLYAYYPEWYEHGTFTETVKETQTFTTTVREYVRGTQDYMIIALAIILGLFLITYAIKKRSR